MLPSVRKARYRALLPAAATMAHAKREPDLSLKLEEPL